jgi:two-component system, sensor histidine kinase and response regulator
MRHAEPGQLPFRAVGARLVRIVLLVASGCVIAATALQAVYAVRIARAEFDARLQEIRLSRLSTISAALRDNQPRLIQSQLKEIAALPQVAGVRLVINGGNIHEAGRKAVDELAADARMVTLNPAGQVSGRLYLSADSQYVLRKVLFDTVLTASLIGLFTTLLCFVLIRTLRAEISGPLQRLMEHINAMSPDAPESFSTPYSSGRSSRPWRDELDQLGDSFASLHASLARFVQERHEAERALAMERDRLERKVAERTHELAIACDQADQANRSKSEFLANMSHEIRTPISAIAGFTTLAMRTELSPRQVDYLDKIAGATHALQRIISDVLDFSKIEAGRLEMERVPFSLHDVLDTAVTYVGAQAERKGLEMLIRVAPGVPSHCIGDPLRLGQILSNLCSNAVKFTDQGEVEVCVSLASAPLQEDDRVRLLFSVRDTGIGLTDEQSSQLFKAFAQADSSTSRKFGGTGLGLVICKRLAALMQGDIWLESRKDAGTTFFFDVELTAMTVEAVPAMPVLPAELAGKRALVVDDNASARQILAAELAELGMEPHVVESGDAAIAELRRATRNGQPYPVVLMDWRMPGLDGVAATRAIRGDKEIAGTPVIIMVTAYAREQVIGTNVDPGMLDNILLKPVTTRLLAQTLCGNEKPAPPQPPEPKLAPEQRLPGVRLLLVEDNPVNQQLARELLEMEGATVSIAENGRIALGKLAARPVGHFHAVLLDLQMPEMDGYETARRIRELPEHSGLPMIAMTAHAMREERERCLAIGMNDHLAKPIDTELLVSTLMQWIGSNSARTAQALPRSASEGSVHAMLTTDLPGIDMKAALKRCGDNARLLQDLLAMFHANYADTTTRMRRLCAEGRWKEASELAHTIKGAAANLAMDELASTAGGLEQALRSGMLAEAAARTEAELP